MDAVVVAVDVSTGPGPVRCVTDEGNVWPGQGRAGQGRAGLSMFLTGLRSAPLWHHVLFLKLVVVVVVCLLACCFCFN